MFAYIAGNLNSTCQTKCLITIDVDNQYSTIFNRKVINKEFSSYLIPKFKIVEIIDEFKNEFSECYINYNIRKLNEIVEKSTRCYLTKRGALTSMNIMNNILCKYSDDGELLQKITYFKYNKDYQKDIYKNDKLIEQENYKNYCKISYKKWNDEGVLIVYKKLEEHKYIDMLIGLNVENEKKYDEILQIINQELKTNATIYNEANEKIFISNYKIMSNIEISLSIDFNIKKNILILNYFNSKCGIEILTNNLEILSEITKLILITKEYCLASPIKNTLPLTNIEKIIEKIILSEYKLKILSDEIPIINKLNKTCLLNKIKISLNYVSIFKDKIIKVKILTIMFYYLNTTEGKDFLLKQNKFCHTVKNKIIELRNDGVIQNLLTQNNETVNLIVSKYLNYLNYVEEFLKINITDEQNVSEEELPIKL